MPANRSALLARKISILDQLRTVTGARLAATFRSLGDYTDEEQWTRVATPVVTAAQTRAASTQVAYLQRILGVRLDPQMSAVLERAAVDLHDPFIAFANAIDKGGQFADALESGASRAEGIGESSVTYAARAASSTAEHHVSEWARIPEAGACEWCLTVAQQNYRTAESASFGHDRCACDVDVA